MRTPDEWASILDRMYERAHPSAENFVRDIVQSIYDDIINIVANENIYDDAVIDLIKDRMFEILGEDNS